MLPQLTAFDRADPTVLQFLEVGLFRHLNEEEVHEWQAARTEAEAAGTIDLRSQERQPARAHQRVGTKA